MSHLEPYEQQDLAAMQQPEAQADLQQVTVPAGAIDLQAWAGELQAAYALGEALCQTDFVPKDFKGEPHAAAAAIMAGKALGLDPMNSLSSIFVIHGKPALYARTMAAMAMQHGHELLRTVATPKEVTIMARRKGQEDWQQFTWTIERAKTAGYTSNPLYQKDPIAMLTAKAQAEACRTIAPDVLTGVAAYSVEEHRLDNIGKPVRPSSIAQPVADSIEAEPEFEPISEASWNELLQAGMQAGLNPGQVANIAATVLQKQLRGWQDIPADQFDNILANIPQPQQGA